MVEVLGIVGSALLGLSGIPQAIQALHEGHARGMSIGMLVMWSAGSALTLLYVVLRYADPWMLTNQSVNLIVIGVLLRYRIRPRSVHRSGS